MKELSLRPYVGRLFLAKSKKEYQKKHFEMFKHSDVLGVEQCGRMTGLSGADGTMSYLIWADKPPQLAHEIAHVVLDVFLRCGIDPRESNGEPFCYMLSQLILDASS